MKKTSCPFCGETKTKVLELCTDGTEILICESCNEIFTDEEIEYHTKHQKRKKKNKFEDEDYL